MYELLYNRRQTPGSISNGRSMPSRVNAELRRMAMAKEFQASRKNVTRNTMQDNLESSSAAEPGTHCRVAASGRLKDDSVYGRLKSEVHSKRFNSVVGLLIVLNAFLIGASSHYEVRCAFLDEGECEREVVNILALINTIFTGIFTFELLLRMFADRFDFCRASGWQWNFTDAVVVFLSLVEEVTFAGGDLHVLL